MRVGVDIGATKIEFVVLDKKNKVIFKKRISTPKSYKTVISDIKLNINSLDKKFKKKIKSRGLPSRFYRCRYRFIKKLNKCNMVEQ